MGGSDGIDADNPIIYFTEDLTNWSISPAFFDLQNHSSVVYDNKIWAIGSGSKGNNRKRMLMSPNGFDWYSILMRTNCHFL